MATSPKPKLAEQNESTAPRAMVDEYLSWLERRLCGLCAESSKRLE